MPDAIELENQRRLDQIANAPDWPTTSRLMNERDTWWKQHRRWDETVKAWVPLVDDDAEWREAIARKERLESQSILED